MRKTCNNCKWDSFQPGGRADGYIDQCKKCDADSLAPDSWGGWEKRKKGG